MSGLPEGWTFAPIASVLESRADGRGFHQGWSPQCEHGPALSEADWAVLKTTAIQDGSFLSVHNKRLPDAMTPRAQLEVQSGDQLITCAGPRSRCGIACLVGDVRPKLMISGKMYRMRAQSTVLDARFLDAFLRSPSTQKQIDAMKTGISDSGMNLTRERFMTLQVPMPPKQEQARIADKLDKLLARVDACRGRLNTAKSMTQRLRQSMLLALKTGRLGTTASETWREVALGDVAEVGTGSTPLKSNPRFYAPVGTPWVTSAATGAPFVTGASEFVTAEAIATCRLKRYAPGTLLVAMYGEGKTRGQVTELAIEATINQACAAVAVDLTQVRRGFVKLILQAQYVELREMAEGGNQPNLNLSKVRSLRFSLPELAVQDEILRFAARLLSVATTVEARLVDVSVTLDSLTRAVLAKAFRGELVPQDPTDEPAELMLERLRATKVPESSPRRRRRPATA